MSSARRVLAFMALLAAPACHRDPAPPPTLPASEKVVLYLNWFPEVEHGGFYDALIHNYYKDEGLDVEIRPGGANSQPARRMRIDAADFGIDNADGILMNRAMNVPIVAVAAPCQDSPICIMVHRSSGIREIRDLKNVTVALGVSSPYVEYLKRRGLLRDVRIVNYLGNIGQFMSSPTFAQQGYEFSEPVLAAARGADPVSLPIRQVGFNPYTSVLIIGEPFLKRRPDVVARLVRASLRGWRHFIKEPGDVLNHLAKENREIPRDLLTECAAKMKPLVLGGLTDPDDVGKMTPERWQRLLSQLVEVAAIKPDAIDLDRVVDYRFLRKSNEGGKAATQSH